MFEIRWLIALGFILVVILFLLAGFKLRKRPLPRCPECHDKNVSVIKQNYLGTRHFTVPGGEDGYHAAYMQQDLEITYYCSGCNHQFSRFVTETNT